MADDQARFIRKTQQQLALLQQYYYTAFADITDAMLAEDSRRDNRSPLAVADWQAATIGTHWDGRDRYFWLRFKLIVPELKKGEHYVLHMQLGHTGEGNNSGFEGLLFVNGHPRQAVDSNHQDAYFDSSHQGALLDCAIKLWTGLEGGGEPKCQHYVLQSLCAGIIDQAVVDCYDYLINIVGIIAELDCDEPLRYRYIELMTQCLHRFQWATLDTISLHNRCVETMTQIRQFIDAHQGEKKGYQITAVGHTHIDVAWLWRLQHTREKIARSFSTVLELMKEYPDYTFFQSTPQDYAFLAEDYPELFQQIQNRIAEGRWEANGATWLEPDTNLTSGESLTRQFLYGGAYFKEHFKTRQNVLWLPDVFGYSAAMPQIMRGFEVDNFMTTKISWNDTNRLPHDTFYWQGIDGSKVLTHCITTVETGEDFGEATSWRYTYNGEVLPKTIFGSYHVYADKQLNDDLLLSYGYGDGGGGPSREEIKNIQILNELPGTPRVIHGHVDTYFDRLAERIKTSTMPVSTWHGELYLEYHRGTYTSQAQIKQANRRAEFALRDLELRYTTAHIQMGVTYPTDTIRALWIIVLRNQFHDILPGSAIHEVYQDAAAEFAMLFAQIATLNQQLDEQILTPAAGQIALNNTLAWPRIELLLDNTKDIDQIVTVPALGQTTINVAPSTTEAKPTSIISGNRITTPYYLISLADDGHITTLYDRHLKRELLAAAGGNVLSLYEDRPLDFDNWNIDKDYPQKSRAVVANSIKFTANTATHTDILITYQLDHSKITQRMRLFANDPRIDFITTVDWHQRQELLRTAFNTRIQASTAQFDIQYGNVARSTTDNTSWDEAMFETCAHKWADLSEADYGIALLNDCKYGYRIKNQQISLSLLKSGDFPDPVADEGTHQFTYSLYPHAGDFRQGKVEKAAAELNQPLAITMNQQQKQSQPLFTTDMVALALDAVKMSEDGQYLIVRFHEYEGRHQRVTITPNVAVNAAFRGELNETLRSNQSLLVDDKITVTMTPYEIVTLCLVVGH